MRTAILFLAISATAITSCTSAYKSGQTPDDVYFSPQRPQAEYASRNDRESQDDYYSYNNDESYYSDRYLRMKVQNRSQWSQLDDWYYNDRFSYSYYNNYYWNNPWSPSNYWNTFYNPYYSSYGFYSPYGYYSPYGGYYSPIIVGGNKGNYNVAANRPRMYNLNTYNNNMLNNNNYTVRRIDLNNAPSGTNNQRYNNYNGSRRNAGDYLRNSFNNNNSRYNGNNNSNNSSFNNNNSSSSGRSSSGSSSSSSGSSSSGGSAPVRRF